ncbi:mucin-17 [Lingula anatina]|uniref:Mucin-17 n=1 Tax=Lingula anatina TaxID=7574 RepID=A0A1S3IJE2_LINAN|nr:mucin-17 [Lingula anatina]|eukprot:XP_013398006.1 mucin-17 [Lingula anatina]
MRMGTSSHRLRGRNNTLCIILAVLIIGTSAQTCDQPLGLQDKRIKSSQITVSSTAANSDKEYVRFGCCDGMTIGGWCPATAAQGEWVQVNFDTPTLITAIQISHPATVDNTRYPTDYLKTYSIKYAVPGSNGTLTDLLEGNQPAIVEGTFNRSLAYKTDIGYLTVDSIRIQVVSFEQQPCFRMELFGCDPYDICPLGCENGGYCNGPNRCQCPFGFYGDRCEHSSLNCNTALGMGDGSIRLNQITASSTAADSRLEYARYGCCDNAGTPVGGWCPATNAKTEYLQVALDKPMRISAIGSRHPGRDDQSTYQTTYLKSYRVRYHVPQTAMWKYYGDYRGAAVFPAAYNDSLSYTIGITPFVTDRIQLYVEDFKNRPCSQFEFFGCDPTNLCSVPCKNGGSCKGPNQCSCPKGFGGAQCQLTPSTVVTQKCVFQNIIGTTLVSTSFNLTVIGNPVLLGNTLQLNGQNQAIQMPRKSRECLGNLNRCTTGLTIGLNVKFQTLTPNAVIISSADLTNPASNGITLLTVSNGLSLNVRTSSLDCTANSQPNILTVNQEVKLEVSFDQQTGVQLYMNNRVVAETKASECQTRRNLNPVSQPITIGGPVTPSGAYATIEVRGLTYWYVSRPNLVNIGLINDTAKGNLSTTTTSPITTEHTLTQEYDLTTLVVPTGTTFIAATQDVHVTTQAIVAPDTNDTKGPDATTEAVGTPETNVTQGLDFTSDAVKKTTPKPTPPQSPPTVNPNSNSTTTLPSTSTSVIRSTPIPKSPPTLEPKTNGTATPTTPFTLNPKSTPKYKTPPTSDPKTNSSSTPKNPSTTFLSIGSETPTPASPATSDPKFNTTSIPKFPSTTAQKTSNTPKVITPPTSDPKTNSTTTLKFPSTSDPKGSVTPTMKFPPTSVPKFNTSTTFKVPLRSDPNGSTTPVPKIPPTSDLKSNSTTTLKYPPTSDSSSKTTPSPKIPPISDSKTTLKFPSTSNPKISSTPTAAVPPTSHSTSTPILKTPSTMGPKFSVTPTQKTPNPLKPTSLIVSVPPVKENATSPSERNVTLGENTQTVDVTTSSYQEKATATPTVEMPDYNNTQEELVTMPTSSFHETTELERTTRFAEVSEPKVTGEVDITTQDILVSQTVSEESTPVADKTGPVTPTTSFVTKSSDKTTKNSLKITTTKTSTSPFKLEYTTVPFVTKPETTEEEKMPTAPYLFNTTATQTVKIPTHNYTQEELVTVPTRSDSETTLEATKEVVEVTVSDKTSKVTSSSKMPPTLNPKTTSHKIPETTITPRESSKSTQKPLNPLKPTTGTNKPPTGKGNITLPAEQNVTMVKTTGMEGASTPSFQVNFTQAIGVTTPAVKPTTAIDKTDKLTSTTISSTPVSTKNTEKSTATPYKLKTTTVKSTGVLQNATMPLQTVKTTEKTTVVEYQTTAIFLSTSTPKDAKSSTSNPNSLHSTESSTPALPKTKLPLQTTESTKVLHTTTARLELSTHTVKDVSDSVTTALKKTTPISETSSQGTVSGSTPATTLNVTKTDSPFHKTDTPESTTMPTERPVTTTTTKPTTVNPLKTIFVDFNTLVTDKILTTTDFNAQLTGTPLVDNTTDKGPAIKLTTDTVCINMGRPSTCLGDVENCTEGLTISFQIKCEQLAENTYILSSGGELPDSYGVAVVYRFGRMQFMLTTSDSSWFGSAPLSTQCQWSRYDLTWKNDTGLAVYQNEILVAEQKQPTPRGQGSYEREPISIGCSSNPKNTTKPKSVWMKNLNFWLTTRTILVREGIIACHSHHFFVLLVTTIPPSTTSTTTKPTTTTTPEPTTTTPWLKTSPGTCPAGCQPIGTTGFPTLPKSPTLDATDSKAPKMLFYCNIPRTSEANVNYFVEWYVNGKVVKNEWVQSTVDRAVLDPVADKQFCFGQGVYCSVRARYTGVCSGPISPPLYSNRFVPSIKLVTQGTIKLREGGEEKNIVLQTNAPPYLLCDRTASIPGDKMCSVSIETGLMQSTRDLRCGDRKTHISQAVFRWLGGNSAAAAYCGLDVSGTKWSENIVIPVKAKADGRYDYKQERLVTVALKTVCGQKIAQKVLTTETKLKVEVTDGDRRAACSSTNDPHMSTFDRRRYNNFYEGEFVLYRHKELPYAVHAFYKKCHRATCNCGVGVKSGDDVIMIDRCQGLKTKRTKKSKKSKRSKYSRGTTYPVQVNIYKNGELTPGTRIFSTNRGQSYEIHMPHGTYVTVQIHGSMYINIVVTPSASDFQRVEGLCGNYDGSSRNDLVKRDGSTENTRSIYPNDFSKSWRVLAGESIYTGVAATRAKGQNNGAIYCDCILGLAPRCGYSFDIETCDVRTRGTEVTRTFLRNAKPARPARYRGKRQAVENAPQIDYPTPPTFDLTFNPDPPSWPAAGMTEQEATEFCKAEIADNAFAAKCNLLTEKNSTEDVEDCVSDILATNSTDYVAQQQEAIKGQCMTELQRDSALSGDNPNPGNLSINVTELTENLCPGNCSGNGTCVEGQCQCNSGLGGADCSTDLDAPPLVAGIPGDGLCDVRTGTCNSSEVYGESFVDSDTLKCMVQEVQVTETDTNVVGEIEVVAATFLNTYMVNCQLPKIASYHIQISNYGLNPSVDKVLFLPYNGICHTCDVVTNDTTAATCKRNDLSCIIDGECYAPDDINPDDECMLCRPESPDFWSVDLACRKRKAAGNSAEGGLTKVDIGVIAAAAGFIVAVMIIGFTYLWCRKNAQMKQKKSAYEQSIHRSEEPSHVYENKSYGHLTPEGGSHTGRYDFVPDGPGEEPCKLIRKNQIKKI